MSNRPHSTRFISNVSWLLLEEYSKWQSSSYWYCDCTLSRPSGFGVINYVASYIAFFTSFIMFGLNGVIVNELVQNRDREGEVLARHCIRLFVSVFSVILSCCHRIC